MGLRGLAGFALTAIHLPAFAALPAQQGTLDTVYYDYVRDDGTLSGGRTTLFVGVGKETDLVLPAPVSTWAYGASGDPANRVDMVFVGDGYTSSELGTYASHVAAQLSTWFAEEPYVTYGPYFNVHVVEVVSNESGVDHDPTYPTWRDTALDMGFWCSGIERLLCINVAKAYAFANNAPDVDLVLALANSSKYGGAGYIGSNLATAAGDNQHATEILLHEIGHALGKLADEYDYADGATYNGAERPERNVSILDASEMAARNLKWAAWLGVNDPAFDGLVDTYEGAYYHQYGIRRPTGNSLMRSLNRPFNLPSLESLVIEMYKIVSPIDDSSDPQTIYAGHESLFVVPMQPVGHQLDVQWYLSGNPIVGATGESLDLCALDLPAGWQVVSVRVTDPTPWVRDEDARANWLSVERAFTVHPRHDGGAAAYCTGAPNSAGVGASIGHTGPRSILANAFTLEASGAIPGQPGLFYYGSGSAQVPFGDGLRCVGGSTFRLSPALAVGPDGTLARQLDFTQSPANAGPGAIEPGALWHFQLWYRDPAAGGAGFNLSNGLRVSFCP